MKTAGQLLQEKRLAKELDLDTIAHHTKVKKEYLEALEKSDFASLPSATTTKGFLKTYAQALRLNPETVLAMFRRDFEETQSGDIIPRGLVKPVAQKSRLITFSTLAGILAVTAFVGFLLYQLIGWWSLPRLELLQPVEGEVYGEKITIKGKTDRDHVVTVAGQKILVSSNGEFSLDLVYPAGTHSLVIEVENRQGKSTLIERTFTVSK